jgi:hypothetical protein
LKKGTVQYAHPDDYKFDSHPIKPNVFIYKAGGRQRLFLRASTKLDSTTFTTATYLFDTSCSVPLQISEYLNKKIRGRILKSDSADYIEFTMTNRVNNLTVHYNLPNVHKPANFAGLPLFFLLGVRFKHEGVGGLEYDEDGLSHNVWKVVSHLRGMPDIEVVTIDVDHGVGVVRRRANQHPLPPALQQQAARYAHNPLEAFTYAELRANRKDLLRLVSVSEFRAWLDEESDAL